MRSVRMALISASIFVTTVPFFVHAEDTLGLDVNFTAESFATPVSKATSFGPSFDLIYKHPFGENLEARMDLGAEFITGANSGMLPSDILGQNAPRSDLRMHEAVMDYHPWDHRFDLQAGAINQAFMDNPLMFGDFAILGAREDVILTREFGQLSFGLEEAIPPSSFSLLDSAASAKTPTFYLAHLDDQWGDKKSTFVGGSVGYFQFDDLTVAQARQSLYAGNTVVGNNSSAAFYLPYRGFEGALQGGFMIAPRWQIVADANAVRNTAAPAGSNAGYLGRLQLNYLYLDKIISGEFGLFNDQSDSSPALFADAFLNSKDHRGTFVGGRFRDSTKRYSIFARWMHSNALVPGLYAGRDDTVMIGLEIRYELRH